MVALLFVLLGALLAVVNRFWPFLAPVVWLIVITVYVLSLSGIARSQRLDNPTKGILIGLAIVFGYFAIGLIAKTKGWSIWASICASMTIFLIASIFLGYLKNLRFSIFQKACVLLGALLLLVALNTVPWRALDTQIRAKEGARQHAFLNDIAKPPNSTQPAVTKVASTKASTTPKSTTADSTEVKPTPGTQKTNNALKWTFISIGVFVIIVGFCSAFKIRSESNDEE